MTDKRTEPCTDARELAKKIQGIYHQGVYEDETSKIAALIQSAFDKIRREDVKRAVDWLVEIHGEIPDPKLPWSRKLMHMRELQIESLIAAILGKEPDHDAE